MPHPSPILRFHAAGDWPPHRLLISRVPDSRPLLPEIQPLIDKAWAHALARPGVKLFDGPMSRLESWHATDQHLSLNLSTTSYKTFLGTNLANPNLADRFGQNALANPVGVSPSLLTADNILMFGRRNASVAYYPNTIHPFAGSLDPADPTPFDAVRRELDEELSLSPADVPEITCTGIAEDLSIRQPELIFAARSILTFNQIRSRLDPAEHLGVWSVPANPQSVAQALIDARQTPANPFTPVALAALLLFGQKTWGPAWFHQNRQTIG